MQDEHVTLFEITYFKIDSAEPRTLSAAPVSVTIFLKTASAIGDLQIFPGLLGKE